MVFLFFLILLPIITHFMKKILKTIALVLLLTAMALPTQAQEDSIPTIAQGNSKVHLPDYDNKTFHFGFLLAFNEMTYALNTVKDYSSIAHPADSWPTGYYNYYNTQNLYVQNVEPMLVPGFTVGITSNLRLGRHFNFRFIPSISFGERHMHYIIDIEDFDGDITTGVFTKRIHSTFVELPINLKYRVLRYNNIGPYLMGGINPKIDLSSQKRNQTIDPQGNALINNFVTRRFDCAAEFGVGLDLYTKWLKLGIEVKMSEGLTDIVKAPAFIYTAPIDQLRNRMFQVSVLVE